MNARADRSSDLWDLSRQLEAARNPSKTLEESCPILARCIRADLADRDLLSLWGWSVNHDELAGASIVSPQVINAILELGPTGSNLIQPDGAIHAGVMHTYAYLFSRLKTEFGYKGDRWNKGQIADAVGLPRELLSPLPLGGTLLANATYFFGRIALRHERRQQARLRRLRARVSRQIAEFDFRRLRWTRLVEACRSSPSRRSHSKGSQPPDFQPLDSLFQSDVIPPQAAGKQSLLIYSVRAGKSPLQLITAFPMADGSLEGLLSQDRLGATTAIRPRHNAFVAGFPSGTVKGQTQLVTVSSRGIELRR